MNKRYEQAKDRAERKEKQYKALFDLKPLEKDVPNKKYFLRSREPLLEVRSPMKFKSKDRFERVKNSVELHPRISLE